MDSVNVADCSTKTALRSGYVARIFFSTSLVVCAFRLRQPNHRNNRTGFRQLLFHRAIPEIVIFDLLTFLKHEELSMFMTEPILRAVNKISAFIIVLLHAVDVVILVLLLFF